jgi:hypothetical protein
MKTLHLSIITIVGIVIIVTVYPPNVYAPCAIGPNGTQLCAGPPPIHMTIKSDSTAYTDGDKITISGNVDQYILSKYGTHLSIKIYNPKMILYRSDQFNTSSNGSFVYSFKIEGENATSGYYNFYLSPDLNTMSYGSAFMYQATPYDLKINGTHYSLVYALVDGVINKIDTSLMEKSITIHVVNVTGHSTLKIKLPRGLIDSKSDQGDTSFTVLADNTPETQYMQSVNFNETQTSSDTRTLLIDLPFHPYSTDGNWYVKIIGTSMDLENKNPPVIITQVELDSSLAFFPDNQTCSSEYGLDAQHSCLTGLIPGKKIQCAYFLGSGTCEPIHQYTSGTNKDCLGSQSSGNVHAPQWFDMYNTQDKAIQLQYFDVKIPSTVSSGITEAGPYYSIPEIGSHEKCTFSFFPINMPMTLDPTNRTILISYNYDGKHYATSAPLLTDVYNDNKTWQFNGEKWTFAEQNTISVPEFPFAVPVMLIGMVSVIVFYGVKFRK